MAKTPKAPNGGSNKKVANSLVTLSSAAVLAIYAAGYAKTRTAAAEIEGEFAVRRPAVPAPAPADRPATEIADLTAASVPPAQPDAAALAPASPVGEPVPAAAAAPSKNEAPEAAPTAASPAAEVSTPALGASAPAAAAAPAGVTSAETVTAVAPAPAAKPAAPAASQVPAVAKTSLVKYKDGTYRGWGRSRHGEIQAFVNIQGGRIVRAGIDKCQTRWSCTLVEHLGPQVVSRQSAEVDYVAGATQSGNAFYYGVVEALEQAASEAPVETEGK